MTPDLLTTINKLVNIASSEECRCHKPSIVFSPSCGADVCPLQGSFHWNLTFYSGIVDAEVCDFDLEVGASRLLREVEEKK